MHFEHVTIHSFTYVCNSQKTFSHFIQQLLDILGQSSIWRCLRFKFLGIFLESDLWMFEHFGLERSSGLIALLYLRDSFTECSRNLLPEIEIFITSLYTIKEFMQTQ